MPVNDRMDKIVCLGSNYLAHAEKFSKIVPEKPVIFIKPPSVMKSAESNGTTLTLPFPRGAGKVHPECEIVLKVKKRGYQLTEENFVIEAVTIGLDVTLRDIQQQLKEKSYPWTISKVFPGSAVVGPWLSVAGLPDYLERRFSFSKDKNILQSGKGKDMRLSPSEALQYINQFFPLCSGDLVFTGTPGLVTSVEPTHPYRVRWEKLLDYTVVWTD